MTATVRAPTYALYGEFLEQAFRDVLHYEPLRTRSAKHDWSIELHKHDTLWQLFHFAQPGVSMQLGDQRLDTETPVVVSIPPLCAHSFRFPRNAPGGVVSLRLPLASQLLDAAVDSDLLRERPWVIRDGDAEYESLRRSFDNLREGYERIDAFRNRSLAANLDAAFVSLLRYVHVQARSEAHRPDLPAHNDALVAGFCELVESHYCNGWGLVDYAAALGVTQVKLNRQCRATLGMPPQRLLARRRMLEAQRLLQYTQGSVADVAEQLGFSDASYFGRFFKKEAGVTPASYRRALGKERVKER